MEYKRIVVTPEIASDWVKKNHPRNRPISQSRVLFLSNQMTLGFWVETHQGIAFDSDGFLIDGQHRLYAVIDSGVPIVSWVSFGLPIESFKSIDDGRKRTPANLLHMAGIDTNTAELATLRVIETGYPNKWGLFSTVQNQELLRVHAEALSFAMTNLPPYSSCSLATTRGIVGRAWYSEDRKELECFCSILKDGDTRATTKRANCTISLRDRVMTNKAHFLGFEGLKKLYRLTCYALDDFLRDRGMAKLSEIGEGTAVRMYPVPSVFSADSTSNRERRFK